MLFGKGFGDQDTMKSRSFTVILHKEDDMYMVEYPEVGTVDQGETIEHRSQLCLSCHESQAEK